MSFVETLWYQTPKLKWYHKPLIPFAKLYQTIMFVRRALYQLHIKKTTHFQVPVIVVGNLTVGGTGKTPVVIALCQWLKQQGYQPGIVSRGYGAKAVKWPQVISHESSADTVGDEPLMLFKKTNVPVVVDPNRVRAVETLLAKFKCDVVVSDDGLQHLAMGRKIEIVLVDNDRQFGNGYCLPLGPLREGRSRLKKANFVLYRGESDTQTNQVNIETDKLVSVVDPDNTVKFSDFLNSPVHALAAIGNPERFFNLLRSNGLQINSHIFRDHHPLQKQDFKFLGENEKVIMTEKDAVKCKYFADHRFFYLSICAKLPEDFLRELGLVFKRG